MTSREVLLGTVAIEPNRWGTVHDDRRPVAGIASWLDTIGDAGFDGLELWESHLTRGDEQRELWQPTPPVRVYNSYVDLDSAIGRDMSMVVNWALHVGARAIKFNVGSAHGVPFYATQIADLLARTPESISLICECHSGTIADDPAVAGEVLSRAGPPERVQALVHTHDSDEHLAAMFHALGERITHVHVNNLDFKTGRAPRLADVADELAPRIRFIRDHLAPPASWTIEFVHGLLTDDDRPEVLVAQATEDLGVLRDLLD